MERSVEDFLAGGSGSDSDGEGLPASEGVESEPLTRCSGESDHHSGSAIEHRSEPRGVERVDDADAAAAVVDSKFDFTKAHFRNEHVGAEIADLITLPLVYGAAEQAPRQSAPRAPPPPPMFWISPAEPSRPHELLVPPPPNSESSTTASSAALNRRGACTGRLLGRCVSGVKEYLFGSGGRWDAEALVPTYTRQDVRVCPAPNNLFVAIASSREVQITMLTQAEEHAAGRADVDARLLPDSTRCSPPFAAVSLDRARNLVGIALLEALGSSDAGDGGNNSGTNQQGQVPDFLAEISALAATDGAATTAEWCPLVCAWSSSSMAFVAAQGGILYLVLLRHGKKSVDICTRVILLPVGSTCVGAYVQFAGDWGDSATGGRVDVSVCFRDGSLGIVSTSELTKGRSREVDPVWAFCFASPDPLTQHSTSASVPLESVSRLYVSWRCQKLPLSSLHIVDCAAFFAKPSERDGDLLVAAAGPLAKPSGSEKRQRMLSAIELLVIDKSLQFSRDHSIAHQAAATQTPGGGTDASTFVKGRIETLHVLPFLSSVQSMSRMAQRRNSGACTSVLGKCSRRCRRRRAGALPLCSISFSPRGEFVAAGDLFGDLNIWRVCQTHSSAARGHVEVRHLAPRERVSGHFWLPSSELGTVVVHEHGSTASVQLQDLTNCGDGSSCHLENVSFLNAFENTPLRAATGCEEEFSTFPMRSTFQVVASPDGRLLVAETSTDDSAIDTSLEVGSRINTQAVVAMRIRVGLPARFEHVVKDAVRQKQYQRALRLSTRYAFERDSIDKHISSCFAQQIVLVEEQFTLMQIAQNSLDSGNSSSLFEDCSGAQYVHGQLLLSCHLWVSHLSDRGWANNFWECGEEAPLRRVLVQGTVSRLSVARLRFFTRSAASSLAPSSMERHLKLLTVLQRQCDANDVNRRSFDGARAYQEEKPCELAVAIFFRIRDAPAATLANALSNPTASDPRDFIALHALFEMFPAELLPQRLSLLRRLLPLGCDPCAYAHLLPALPRATENIGATASAAQPSAKVSVPFYWMVGTSWQRSQLRAISIDNHSINTKNGVSPSLESLDVLCQWYATRIRRVDAASGMLGHCLTLCSICDRFLPLDSPHPTEKMKSLLRLMSHVRTLCTFTFTASIQSDMSLVSWEASQPSFKLKGVVAHHFCRGLNGKTNGLTLAQKLVVLKQDMACFSLENSPDSDDRGWGKLLQSTTLSFFDIPRRRASAKQPAMRSEIPNVSPLTILQELLDFRSDAELGNDVLLLFESEAQLLELCIAILFDDRLNGSPPQTWTSIKNIVDAVAAWEGHRTKQGNNETRAAKSRTPATTSRTSQASLLSLNARIEETRLKWVPAGTLMRARGMSVSPADFQHARSLDLAGDVSPSLANEGISGKTVRRSGAELLNDFVITATRQLNTHEMERGDWWDFVADCVEVAELAFYWVPRSIVLSSLGRELLSHGQFDVAFELIRPTGKKRFSLNDEGLARMAVAAAAEFFNSAHSLYLLSPDQNVSMHDAVDDPLTMSARCLSMCPRSSAECEAIREPEQQLHDTVTILRKLHVIDRMPIEVRLCSPKTDLLTWVFESHPHACILSPLCRMLAPAVECHGDGPAFSSSHVIDATAESSERHVPDGRSVSSVDVNGNNERVDVTGKLGAPSEVDSSIRYGHLALDMLRAAGIEEEITFAEAWLGILIFTVLHCVTDSCLNCLSSAAHVCQSRLGPWLLEQRAASRNSAERSSLARLEAANSDFVRVATFLANGGMDAILDTPVRGKPNDAQKSEISLRFRKDCCILALQLASFAPTCEDDLTCATPEICWWRPKAYASFVSITDLSQSRNLQLSYLMAMWNRLEIEEAESWHQLSSEEIIALQKRLGAAPSEVVMQAATKALTATANAVTKATSSYMQHGGLIGLLASRYGKDTSGGAVAGDTFKEPVSSIPARHNSVQHEGQLTVDNVLTCAGQPCAQAFLDALAAFPYNTARHDRSLSIHFAYGFPLLDYQKATTHTSALHWPRQPVPGVVGIGNHTEKDCFVHVKSGQLGRWETQRLISPSFSEFHNAARLLFANRTSSDCAELSAVFSGVILAGLLGSPTPMLPSSGSDASNNAFGPTSEADQEDGPFFVVDVLFLEAFAVTCVIWATVETSADRFPLEKSAAKVEDWLFRTFGDAVEVATSGAHGQSSQVFSEGFRKTRLFDAVLRFRWLLFRATSTCVYESMASAAPAVQSSLLVNLHEWSKQNWLRIQPSYIANFMQMCRSLSVGFETHRDKVETTLVRAMQLDAMRRSLTSLIRKSTAFGSSARTMSGISRSERATVNVAARIGLKDALADQLLSLQSKITRQFDVGACELVGLVRAVVSDILKHVSKLEATPEDWVYVDHCFVVATRMLDPTLGDETVNPPPLGQASSVAALHVRTFVDYCLGCMAHGRNHIDDHAVALIGLICGGGLDGIAEGTSHLALALLAGMKAICFQEFMRLDRVSQSKVRTWRGSDGNEQHPENVKDSLHDHESFDHFWKREDLGQAIKTLRMHQRMLKNVSTLAWNFSAKSFAKLDYHEATCGPDRTWNFLKGLDYVENRCEPLVESFRGAAIACADTDSILAYASLAAKFAFSLRLLRSSGGENPTFGAGLQKIDTDTLRVFIIFRVTDAELQAMHTVLSHGSQTNAGVLATVAIDLIADATKLVDLIPSFLPHDTAGLQACVSELSCDSFQPLLDCDRETESAFTRSDQDSSSIARVALDRSCLDPRHRLVFATAIHIRQLFVAAALLQAHKSFGPKPVSQEQRALLGHYFHLRGFLEAAQRLLSASWCSKRLITELLLSQGTWPRSRHVLARFLCRCWQWMYQEKCMTSGTHNLGISSTFQLVALLIPLEMRVKHELELLVQEAVAAIVEGAAAVAVAGGDEETVCDVQEQLECVLANTLAWDLQTENTRPHNGRASLGATRWVVNKLRDLATQKSATQTPGASIHSAIFAALENRGLSTPKEHLEFLRCRIDSIVNRFVGQTTAETSELTSSPNNLGTPQLKEASARVIQWSSSSPPQVNFDRGSFKVLVSQAEQLPQLEDLREMLRLWKKVVADSPQQHNPRTKAKHDAIFRSSWRELLLHMAASPVALARCIGSFVGTSPPEFAGLLHQEDVDQISAALHRSALRGFQNELRDAEAAEMVLAALLWDVQSQNDRLVDRARECILVSAESAILRDATKLESCTGSEHDEMKLLSCAGDNDGSSICIAWWTNASFCKQLVRSVGMSTLVEQWLRTGKNGTKAAAEDSNAGRAQLCHVVRWLGHHCGTNRGVSVRDTTDDLDIGELVLSLCATGQIALAGDLLIGNGFGAPGTFRTQAPIMHRFFRGIGQMHSVLEHFLTDRIQQLRRQHDPPAKKLPSLLAKYEACQLAVRNITATIWW